MALAEYLNGDLFKKATLSLGFKTRNMEWAPDDLRACAAALRIVAENGMGLAEQTEKDLMAIVNRGMIRLYPDHEQWDDPQLRELLAERASLMERVADGKSVDRPSLESLFHFCEEMWVDLTSYERRTARNI